MKPYRTLRTMIAASVACVGLGGLVVATADDGAPLSYKADPSVYKLLAENEMFRVVLATWKPGQRDAYHSHSANAVYRLTECSNRAYDADGKVAGERAYMAGSVALQNPVPKHSVENIGSKECQVLIVERK